MTNEKAGPVIVRTTPGAPLAPEPHAANYHDEVPAEVHAYIETVHPQAELAKGRVVSQLDW